MRKLLLAAMACCLMETLVAQDPNFSQFFVSPLSLNPALTGKFNGNYRVAFNYRDQWPAISKAFVTSTASFDLPVYRNDIDTWGVGVIAMSDKTANGILSTNFISVTTAYHKGLDQDGLNQIGVGFQATYNTKRLDGTKLNFESELDQFGGWTIASGEPVDNQQVNISYFDMSVGALFNGSTDGYNNYYLGVAGYHINKPRESFDGNIFYTLAPRITVHGGGSFPLGGDNTRNIYISSLYSRQAGASNIVIGGAAGFTLNEDEENPTNFYAGLWSRFNNVSDAVIPYVGLEFGGFRIGASYDVNISSLKTASQSRGGIEVSLIYTRRPPGSKGIPCPRF